MEFEFPPVPRAPKPRKPKTFTIEQDSLELFGPPADLREGDTVTVVPTPPPVVEPDWIRDEIETTDYSVQEGDQLALDHAKLYLGERLGVDPLRVKYEDMVTPYLGRYMPPKLFVDEIKKTVYSNKDLDKEYVDPWYIKASRWVMNDLPDILDIGDIKVMDYEADEYAKVGDKQEPRRRYTRRETLDILNTTLSDEAKDFAERTVLSGDIDYPAFAELSAGDRERIPAYIQAMNPSRDAAFMERFSVETVEGVKSVGMSLYATARAAADSLGGTDYGAYQSAKAIMPDIDKYLGENGFKDTFAAKQAEKELLAAGIRFTGAETALGTYLVNGRRQEEERHSLRRLSASLQTEYDGNIVSDVIVSGTTVGLDLGAAALSGLAAGPTGVVAYSVARFAGDFNDMLVMDYGVSQDTAFATAMITALPYAAMEKLQLSRFSKLANPDVTKKFVNIYLGILMGSSKEYLFEAGIEGGQKALEEAVKQMLRVIGQEGLKEYGIDESIENVERELIGALEGMLIPVLGASVAGGVKGRRTAIAGEKIKADIAAEIRRTSSKANDAVEQRWANQMMLVYDGMIQSGKTDTEAKDAIRKLATAAYLSPDRKIQLSVQAKAAADAMAKGGDIFDEILNSRADYPGFADSFYRQDTNVPVISMVNNQSVAGAVAEGILAGMRSPANIVNNAALKTGIPVPEFAQAGSMLSEQVKAWTSKYFDFGARLGFSPTFVADDYKVIRDTTRDYLMFIDDMDYGKLRMEAADLSTEIKRLQADVAKSAEAKDAAPKGKKKSFYKAGRKAGRRLDVATARLESVSAALAVETSDTLESRRAFITAKLKENAVKSVKYEVSTEKMSDARRQALDTMKKELEEIPQSRIVLDFEGSIQKTVADYIERTKSIYATEGNQLLAGGGVGLDIVSALKTRAELDPSLVDTLASSMPADIAAALPRIRELTVKERDAKYAADNRLSDAVKEHGGDGKSYLKKLEALSLDADKATSAWREAAREYDRIQMQPYTDAERHALEINDALSKMNLAAMAMEWRGASSTVKNSIVDYAVGVAAKLSKGDVQHVIPGIDYAAIKKRSADTSEYREAVAANIPAPPKQEPGFARKSVRSTIAWTLSLQDTIADILERSNETVGLSDKLRDQVAKATQDMEAWADKTMETFSSAATAAIGKGWEGKLIQLAKPEPGLETFFSPDGKTEAPISVDQLLYRIAFAESPGNLPEQEAFRKRLPEMYQAAEEAFDGSTELLTAMRAAISSTIPSVDKALAKEGIRVPGEVSEGTWFPHSTAASDIEGFEKINHPVRPIPSFAVPRVFDPEAGAMNVASAYITEAAAFVNTRDVSTLLRDVFLTSDMMQKMAAGFGEQYAQSMRSKITDFANQSSISLPGGDVPGLAKARAYTALAGMSFSVSSMVNQIVTFPTMILEARRAGGFFGIVRNNARDLKGYVQALKTLKDSPEIGRRLGKGYSEAVANAYRVAKNDPNMLMKAWQFGMKLPSYGDYFSSVAVGAALYNSIVKSDPVISNLKGKAQAEAAMVRTVDMIESAYQSKHMKDLPSWLRRGDIGKFLGQFSSGQARTTSMLLRNLRTEVARAKTAGEKSKAMAKWAGATFGTLFITNALMTLTRAMWAAMVGDDDKRLETIMTGTYDKLSGPEENFRRFMLNNGFNWAISEPLAGIPGVNMALSALADKLTGRRVWGGGVPSVDKMVDIASSVGNMVNIMGGMIEGEEDMEDFTMGVVEAVGSTFWPARMLERWLKNQEE